MAFLTPTNVKMVLRLFRSRTTHLPHNIIVPSMLCEEMVKSKLFILLSAHLAVSLYSKRNYTE